MNKKTSDNPQKQSGIFKFLIPSLIGIFIFLCPIPWKDSINIPIGILSDILASWIKPFAPQLLLAFTMISALISLFHKLFKPKLFTKYHAVDKLFSPSWYYLIIRILGAIFTLMIVLNIGSKYITSPDTGGTMLSLLQTLIAWFFVASFLMPLLMEFGIMEYVGTLLKDFTRPLFKIPGRSTVDLLASWVGNCNVGVVLTNQQYEKGYYTAREAITISTCFSAVSLPFCMVIAALLKVETKFIPFYIILCLTGMISVIIMTRIPPLATFSDAYYPPVGKKTKETDTHSLELKKHPLAVQLATEKAKEAPSIKEMITNGFEIFFDIIFNLTPIVMCYGTLALILATYTPLFDYLSLPFKYYLGFLGLDEAATAAPATIVGFADMFIPAILAQKIASFQTRFVIGILSLVQIIYMTEVGTLILTSKIPIKFRHLLILFLQKTIIALPIIVLLTKLFGI